MNSNITTIPAVIAGRLVRGRTAANILLVTGASALIALAAQIAIPLPFNPVPMTLQPLAIIFLGAALGSWRGAAAAALYLLEGASGLPVFAEGKGGLVWLTGPTAGYLLAYPLAGWVAGRLSELGWAHRIVRSSLAMIAALGVIYLGGWSWLATLTSPVAAWTLGVAPFLVADLVKVALGAALLPYAEQIIAKTTISK